MSYPVFLILKTAAAVSFALSLYPTALCGRVSLGHAGTLAIGAYLFATTESVTLPVVALTLFSFLLSYFTSHLSNENFGALTLALGEAVRIFLSNTQAVGGASGYVLKTRHPYFALISLFLSLTVCALISRSRLSLYLKAQKDEQQVDLHFRLHTRF